MPSWRRDLARPVDMGWYEQAIYPRLLEWSLDVPGVHAERARALAPARGEILEVGPGTGLNFPHYPPSVNRLTVVTPQSALDPRAERRAGARSLEIAQLAGGAERLPVGDASFDTLVCTFLLCCVPDPRAAAREFARALRPGGQLLVLEHVAAPRGSPRRLAQRLSNPANRLIGCGCSLLNDPVPALVDGGFAFTNAEELDVPVLPWLLRRTLRGVAVLRRHLPSPR
jgi:ubiquinone/menaquinone biosynthesis C-methylase UbiE